MYNKVKTKVMAAFCMACMILAGTAGTAFAAGALSIAVSSGTVKAGDTVTVTVYAEGPNNEDVTADMNISYDSAKLEYVSSSVSNASGGGGTVKASASSLEIKFKAVGSGDAYVKAEGATMTAAGTHITVSGTASSETAGEGTAKSGDNSLSALTISNGTLSPAFKGSVTEYTAQVGSDVREITVNPVTSNSKAEIVSVTGNKDLKEGKNVITIVVKAENGTEASYKITVTKGGSSASPEQADREEPASEQKPEGEGGADTDQTAGAADGGMITIDGVNYKISNDFQDEIIPEGFSRTDFEYKGTPCKGVIFDYGRMGMFYMVNDSGEGRFFVYDSDRDKFYPFVRLSSGEHFIVLMVVPNAVIPPDNYEETTLTIGDVSNISAYQYNGGEDKEIVKIEAEDGSSAAEASDFYIFYGMDSTGVSCWYQYDAVQGTYQRLNEEAASSSENTEDYESLSESYKELNERQKETKAKDRRIIAVLIFVTVVLLILIINLLLKIREIKSDDEEEYEEPERRKRVRPVKREKRKSPPAKKKTRTYTAIEESEKETDFYEDDDADIMDEFEEDPVILKRKPKKKDAPPPKTDFASRKSTEPELSDDDDDLEFLDLNDF